eukprot:scaffold7012_cov157-Amphora_coffeaeformis.AAC.19
MEDSSSCWYLFTRPAERNFHTDSPFFHGSFGPASHNLKSPTVNARVQEPSRASTSSRRGNPASYRTVFTIVLYPTHVLFDYRLVA